MEFIAVDLGSTNIKAAVYDQNMTCIVWRNEPVVYQRENGFVEFDAEKYVNSLISMIADLSKDSAVNPSEIIQISFTGQAESLVVLDKYGIPLMNAISWMDERSVEECVMIEKEFSHEESEATTGQLAVLPTWPATKILWLKRNKPEIFNQAAKYMLLKDFVVYIFSGRMIADCSIATFTFYFDIYKKCYWTKMLNFCGIFESQLPPLVEPCTVAGTLTPHIARRMGLTGQVGVNVGTLDHFGGMIGTGNVKEGGVSLSTGTVMAVASMAKMPASKKAGIAMHYGFIPGTYVMLPVAESGGICLEWFKRICMKDITYHDLDNTLQQRKLPNKLLFLPYIVGINAPEFDSRATGVFYGLRSENDVYDMAYAVMEGVVFLLRKNCETIKARGTDIGYIIATGGGARSAVWCQLQADITGLPVVIPKEKEAACYGAAIISAVSEGIFHDYEEAAQKVIQTEKRYEPQNSCQFDRKYKQFCALYDSAIRIAQIE